MTHSDPAALRRALADRLEEDGVLKTPAWRKAVESVPRELFLPSFFNDALGPGGITQYTPVTRATDEGERLALVYRNETWVTQLDGHRLGEDNVTSVEVDPAVSQRADAALEAAGYSTWTVTGDGLLGHPRRAPYDRTIATCALRRIPYAWVRQTRPGGVVLATVGPSAWSYGTGLAKLTVKDDGTAEGPIVGRTSFMPARAEAAVPLSGDLSARAAYADTERRTSVSPDLLNDWMPAFLAQLAAPGAQLVRAVSDGQETVYLFDTSREAFAALTADGDEWTVRQGGPVAIWDAVESTLAAWRDAGEPDITSARLEVTPQTHTYRIADQPALRWSHPHPPLHTSAAA